MILGRTSGKRYARVKWHKTTRKAWLKLQWTVLGTYAFTWNCSGGPLLSDSVQKAYKIMRNQMALELLKLGKIENGSQKLTAEFNSAADGQNDEKKCRLISKHTALCCQSNGTFGTIFGQTKRYSNYTNDAPWWQYIATEILIYATMSSTKAKGWHSWSNMTTKFKWVDQVWFDQD